MQRFQIESTNPEPYRGEIIEFWKKYLPGTPPERLDWLESGNPAGPTIWYFAFSAGGKRSEPLGTISLTPVNLFLKGERIKAGILGDFMIHENHRVFGPTLDLVKAPLNDMAKHGLSFIYGIPNQESEKIMLRVGLKKSTDLVNLVRPVRLGSYLSKYVSPLWSSLLSPPGELGLKLFSSPSLSINKAHVGEVDTAGPEYDALWEEIKKKMEYPVGDRTSTFLEWKYLRNPHNHHHILFDKEGESGKIVGYLVYSKKKDVIEIVDIQGLNGRIVGQLLTKSIQTALREGCKAVYFRIPQGSSLKHQLYKKAFVEGRDSIALYGCGPGFDVMKNWEFFFGDRNL
jgi:hypothetical protein